MSTTYAQRQTTAQKKDAPSAFSVFDASSQSESLQRKADLLNSIVQCAGGHGRRGNARRRQNQAQQQNLALPQAAPPQAAPPQAAPLPPQPHFDATSQIQFLSGAQQQRILGNPTQGFLKSYGCFHIGKKTRSGKPMWTYNQQTGEIHLLGIYNHADDYGISYDKEKGTGDGPNRFG